MLKERVRDIYCRALLGVKPEFSELNPTALTLLILMSEIHTLTHRSIIDGYSLPKTGPAIVTGNHRAQGDNLKLCIAGIRQGRLIRAIVKKGLVEKGFIESAEYLESIGAQDESLKYNPVTAFTLRGAGTEAVDREHPDAWEFKRFTSMVLRSQILGLFMEAHRYKEGTLQYLQTGPALLAKLHPKIPVYPFASSGSPDGPDRLTFVKPYTVVELEQEYGRKLSRGEITIITADMIAPALPERPRMHWKYIGREVEANLLEVDLNKLKAA